MGGRSKRAMVKVRGGSSRLGTVVRPTLERGRCALGCEPGVGGLRRLRRLEDSLLLQA